MKLKKTQKTKPEDELNFWQPTSDLMSALMCIMMLVIVLLGLYIIQIPEHSEIDPDLGDSYADGHWLGGASPTPTATWDWDDNGGGYGGGRQTPEPTPTPSPTPTVSPTPDLPGAGGGSGGGFGGGNGGGEGPGDTPDLGAKSAVYVMMVDAETERTIKEQGVEFELYNLDGAIQILNTYYPDRITFRSYLTTENGTFYFPEKLPSNTYELHEMTEPEGYDASSNIVFVLDDVYDWTDPLVVRVPLYPSRNIIRVQMNDAKTGQAVAGGTFDIIAADDILTADGTLRYRKGQTVGLIECGESGYGESEEIYLGAYTLRQHDIPKYYASYDEEIPVEVAKKASVLPEVNTVACDRTRLNVMVADELYPDRGVEGAVLNVRPSVGQPFTVTTDYAGLVKLDELEKGVTYRITQTVAAGGYQMDRGEYTVAVTADGRIDSEAETELNMTNRLIRVMIGITDEFSKVQIPGMTMTLYSSADELIRTWTTTGTAQSFTDLKPGTYYVILGSDTEKHYGVTVRDQAAIQELNIHTTYVMQYVIYGGLALVILAVTAAVILAVRKRRKH